MSDQGPSDRVVRELVVLSGPHAGAKIIIRECAELGDHPAHGECKGWPTPAAEPRSETPR